MRREFGEGIEFVESGHILAFEAWLKTRLRVDLPVESTISVEEFEMERRRCLAIDFGR